MRFKRMEEGISPGEKRGSAEARDQAGSMGTHPVGFQAGFGFMSPQQTGQLISPAITIPHCYYRHGIWFTGWLLSDKDGLAGVMCVTSVDGELSKWYSGPPTFGLQSHLHALVNA